MSKVGAIEFVSVSIELMNTTELQQAALRLPKQERAQLAHLLLESLDQPSESDVEQLWLFEAERRAAQIDRGEVQLVTAEELEAQVQDQFK
jgi:putative addiction module component (TIGR02574 family)